MNMAKQTIWLLVAALLLIGSSWYYKQLKPTIRLDNETLSTTIDSTVTKLTVRQFNENGELANLLTTPLMEHIPKDNIHLLQTPHIVIKEKDQPEWEINSRTAKSYQGGERITFINKVVVHQNPDKKTQESTLKTEEVTYFPKEKRATTELFVTFEQPGNIIESTGMNAYLEEKRVELLHGAKGSYAPTEKG
ncbi:LPS export ABC transporter periplasmic protein LptC [Legionella sp. km772]|uniref:LPS export ABC transporter periplasmic protein LptC n=1 Tax=Legionella sp. km772 TaxID=2498111 RepID=UPI000F8F47F4|nr:LPS export ABC transporter periplasmic protein LptC [Legionella sp. km772]RUR08968.1 LPS export ABC transporter periplasmic protein LptC [Legionella sp. km772]